MTTIADDDARQRFVRELDRNFSVIASAGSGKTRAINDRIVESAKDRQRAAEWLPQLVVVTYTNRAADEMQQRTRQRILEAGLALETVEAFGRAFFGSIHAFCVKLLATHGHRLGLPARLELITDDDDLWNEFVQQQTHVGRSLSAESRAKLLRLASMRHIMELGRQAGSALLRPGEESPCPEIELDEVLRVAKAAKKSETVWNSIAQLEAWKKGYDEETGFL